MGCMKQRRTGEILQQQATNRGVGNTGNVCEKPSRNQSSNRAEGGASPLQRLQSVIEISTLRTFFFFLRLKEELKKKYTKKKKFTGLENNLNP